MVLATSQQRAPKEMLSEVCRTKGIDESEVFEALEALAHRIEETDALLDLASMPILRITAR
jgi:predicted transcriptional regulator with HTH domain